MLADNKHVLMIANAHVRDDPRVMVEAAALVNDGYSVQVIGAGRIGGKPTHESVQNVCIVNVPMVVSWNPIDLLREAWRLLLGDVGQITDGESRRRNSRLATFFFSLWVLRIGWKIPANIVHAHDAPQLPEAWFLAWVKQAKLIYDAHEDALGYFGRIGALIEKLFISRVDVVITIGDRLAKVLRERGARKVVIVGSWKRLGNYQIDPAKLETLRGELELPPGLIICFYGTLDGIRYLPELLAAVEASPEITLLIAGKGPLADTVIASSKLSPNIRWLGWLSYDDVPIYTCLADVVYSPVNPEAFKQAYYVAPNKLYEAFAAGKALIAQRGVGEMGEILERIPAAILLDNFQIETLKETFKKLQNSKILGVLQQNALEGRKQYNWETSQERLFSLYADLVNKTKTSRR